MTQTPRFLLLFSADGSADSLINLDQIRTVDQITDTSLRLMFSGDHAVTVNGTGVVQEILGLIGQNAITPDGRTLAEVLMAASERIEPQLPSSVLLEGRGLGAVLQHLVVHREPLSD